MKRQYIRAVCAAFVFAVLACAGDPTSALRTGPFLLSVTPGVTYMDPAASVAIVVVARDEQLNPVAIAITASSANTAIATVAADTARHFVDGATQGFLVTGVSSGTTKINISAGGLTGTTTVNVN